MKKLTLFFILLVLMTSLVFAQTTTDDPSAPDATKIGTDTAQQKLKEISVSKFEDAGFWYGMVPGDFGIIQIRSFPGGPKEKEPIQEEIDAGIVEVDQDNKIVRGDNNVIGVKVSFYKRGVVDFNIRPVRPIPVPGKTKVISVWVAGRESKHRLEVVVSDYYGNSAYIDMGRLDFPGWRKLTVAVPQSLKQRDPHYHYLGGITVRGFNVKCDIDETYGSFFIYLDDLRVVTDLFEEEIRDTDDMLDAW
jgi:hypothetical protein